MVCVQCGVRVCGVCVQCGVCAVWCVCSVVCVCRVVGVCVWNVGGRNFVLHVQLILGSLLSS